MDLKTSIIIPTKDRPKDIISCLKALKKQTKLPDEIIIIDSSSKSLRSNINFNNVFNSKTFTQVNLIYQKAIPGTSTQRNIGIKLATKDLIFFLDDDSTIEPNYIQELSETFIKQPNFIGGMCDYKKNGKNIPFWLKLIKKSIQLQPIIKKLFFLQHDYGSGKISTSGFARHPYGTNKFKAVKALGGCCVYRKEALEKFNFDQNLEKLGPYAYMEDFDLSYRIGQKHQLFFIPAKLISHNMSPINRTNIEQNRLNYIYNYSYLFFKNIYPKNKLKIIFYWWSIFGLFIEAITLLKKDYIKGYAKGLYLFYFKH